MNKTTILVMSAMSCLGSFFAITAQVSADEVTYGPNYIAVLPGYSFPSKDIGNGFTTTGNGATVSGIFGHNFAPKLSLELNIQSSTFETGTQGGTDFYQNGATVDLAYNFFDRHSAHWLNPFLLAGIGGVYDDFYPNSRDGAAFIANAGVGVLSKPLFSNGIRLRLDARYVRDTKDGGFSEGRLLAGIEIPLGRTTHQVEYLPGKIETREVIKEVQVQRQWIDSDRDGVDDEHDKCPDTPRGMKVDKDGCVIADQTFQLQGVTFEYNKARLTINAQTVLDMVTLAVVGQPTLRVEVAGHTDTIGSAKANLKLSQLRADAVRSYLISKGAVPTQLIAKGYGKTQLLVVPETNERDRELNRRVELRVLAK